MGVGGATSRSTLEINDSLISSGWGEGGGGGIPISGVLDFLILPSTLDSSHHTCFIHLFFHAFLLPFVILTSGDFRVGL